MHHADTLQKLGLTPQESAVYLALLKLGEASVQHIAKEADIQRPNCYAILESLAQKGLIGYQRTSRGRSYIAQDPSILSRIQQQKTVLLNSALPELRSLYSQAPTHAKIRTYEAKEGIHQLYEEILESDGYDGIYSPEALLPIWGNYSSEFGIRAVEKGMTVRELVATNERPVPYAKYFKAPKQQIRYLTPDEHTMTDIVLFENKLVLVAYEPTIHAVTIEGSSIVDTHRYLFDLAWKQAK